jgi:apolipoprotein N-acyltransferase
MRGFGTFLFAPVVSGVLTGLTLIPNKFGPYPQALILFCYVPLWASWLKQPGPNRTLTQGWIAQAVLSAVAFHWVAHTVAEFGQVPFPVALLAFFLFAACANLHIPLGAYLWARVFPRGSGSLGLRVFTLFLFQAAAERLVPMLFDWHLGYAWYYLNWPAYNLADTIGFAGLGTVTLGINAILTYAILVRDKPRLFALGALAVVLLALHLGGLARARAVATPNAAANALVIQPNIGNRDKLRAEDPAYLPELVNRYLRLTGEGLERAQGEGKRVDFAVWPENAFPDVISELGSVEAHFQALQDFLVSRKLTLLTGGYGFSDEGEVTNAFFVIAPRRSWRVPTYHKTHLLAFGEYLPGARWLPALRNIFPAVGNFAAGRGPAVLPVGTLRVGPQICYEGLFDGFSRASANSGAEIFVNITNDSWYGSWPEPRQHLYLTLGRAIETRRPLLRATNTGISAAVLANGKLLQLSPMDQAWTGVYEIPYRENPEPTPFQEAGYWLIPGAIALGLAATLLMRARKKIIA